MFSSALKWQLLELTFFYVSDANLLADGYTKTNWRDRFKLKWIGFTKNLRLF